MLKSLYLHNYKSFYDTTIHFDQFNCLLGLNNSGKSNVIDALEFLDIATRNGLDVAIKDKGRINSIKNYRNDESKIVVQASLDEYSQMVLNPSGCIQGVFFITIACTINNAENKYEIQITGRIRSVTFDKVRMGGTIVFIGFKDFNDVENLKQFFEVGAIQNNEKYIDTLIKKNFEDFSLSFSGKEMISNNFDKLESEKYNNLIQFLELTKIDNHRLSVKRFIHSRNISVLKKHFFSTHEIKSITRNETDVLNERGTNLIEYLLRMRKENPNEFQMLSEAIIGEVAQLEGVTIDESLDVPVLKFSENFSSGRQHEVSYKDISDGTLHFISILTAVIFPQTEIVMIEEPERHMHLKTIQYLLSKMRESKSQIIITTHSSEVLKELDFNEMIFIYRDSNGYSRAKKGSEIPNLQEMMETMQYDIDDMIKSGLMDDLEHGL